MSTGTDAGLLTTLKATSVFKHELLKQYSSAFFAKVASKSDRNRVCVIDGFAGRGEFPDGTPGSAAHFMEAAMGLAPTVKASIRLFEQNPSDADHLVKVATRYATRGLDVVAECADVRTRLDEAVAAADGIPLFLFLDPCGQNVSFDMLSKIVTGVRAEKWPATEVLLNFSADFTRRISGVLNAGHNSAALSTMDAMVGGDWWRQVALQVHASTPDGSWGPAADAIADKYAQLLGKPARMGGASIPVRRRPGHQPTYHLVYLTRSNEGLWVMADAVARARQRWLREFEQVDDDEQTGLFEVDPIGDKIVAEQETATEAARKRVLTVARRERRFRLVDHVIEVYGTDYGKMSQATLTRVVGDLKNERLLDREPGARVQQAWLTYIGL